jgi:hypothetical protein
MATAELKVRIDAETGQLKKGLNDANQKLGTFASKANNSVGGFAKNTSALMGTVAASIAGAFSVGAVIGFTKQVFNATAQFQKFEAVLGNTLGSSALAGLKLKEIQEFAAKTPFGVNELTNSFVKLANQGFKPTGDQMRLLGDLASSTGKSFDQLAEAIIDAQVGEFERLKEFGVRAQDAGDKVIFTFKGVQTQVDKSSSAIREYITSLGNAEGVSGSMAVISETLGGKINNLGDSWDQMLISIGGNTKGVFSSVISIVGKAIDEITGFNRRLELVSKFKLKEDFGLNFQGGKIKISDVKGEVAQVEAAQKSVQNYIKSIQEIAKTPEEFKSAIKSLIEINREQITGLNNNNVAKAITAQFQEGVNQLNALSKEAAKIKPTDANFGKGKTVKEGKTESEKLEEEKKKRAQLIISEGKAFEGKLELLKISNRVAESIQKETEAQKLFNEGLEEATLIGERFQSEIFGKKLIEPVKSFGDYLKGDILPQLGSSFKTFFDEILIRGKFSFAALGKAILNTFASVIASQAANGVINLLSGAISGGGGTAGGSSGGKIAAVGGLAGLVGKLFKGGGKVAEAGSEVAKKGFGKFLGTALPIAGVALAAAPILFSLFKKKQPAQPQPAFTTSNAISTSSSSNVDFGNGRVVFEISGVNLVGVLNRAGAKLQRFGP